MIGIDFFGGGVALLTSHGSLGTILADMLAIHFCTITKFAPRIKMNATSVEIRLGQMRLKIGMRFSEVAQ